MRAPDRGSSPGARTRPDREAEASVKVEGEAAEATNDAEGGDQRG